MVMKEPIEMLSNLFFIWETLIGSFCNLGAFVFPMFPNHAWVLRLQHVCTIEIKLSRFATLNCTCAQAQPDIAGTIVRRWLDHLCDPF